LSVHRFFSNDTATTDIYTLSLHDALPISLTDEQLDTPYREGGWTVRQVVHHCADSHTNAMIRFKLAITEPSPVIKPYEEALWAQDRKSTRLNSSHVKISYAVFCLKKKK